LHTHIHIHVLVRTYVQYRYCTSIAQTVSTSTVSTTKKDFAFFLVWSLSFPFLSPKVNLHKRRTRTTKEQKSNNNHQSRRGSLSLSRTSGEDINIKLTIMSTLSLKIIPLIAFLAVAHHVERGDGTRELAIESCFSHAEIDESRYRHYASYKLKNVANVSSIHHYHLIL
jgi:hypothetical protein